MTKIVGDGCVTSRTSTEGFGEFYRVRREEGGIPMAWEEGQRPCTASSSPISLSYEEVSYNVYKYIDGRRDREQFVVPLWGAGYWSVHHIVSRGIDILGNRYQELKKNTNIFIVLKYNSFLVNFPGFHSSQAQIVFWQKIVTLEATNKMFVCIWMINDIAHCQSIILNLIERCEIWVPASQSRNTPSSRCVGRAGWFSRSNLCKHSRSGNRIDLHRGYQAWIQIGKCFPTILHAVHTPISKEWMSERQRILYKQHFFLIAVLNYRNSIYCLQVNSSHPLRSIYKLGSEKWLKQERFENTI